MDNFIRSLFCFKLVWQPLFMAALFLGAFLYFAPDDTTTEPISFIVPYAPEHHKIAVRWIEGTYMAVGLGAAEGLQSERNMFFSPTPLYIQNPVSSYALDNNLSIACLQLDSISHYTNRSDLFVVRGNITFQGPMPFNKHLNNSVMYTKSIYLRNNGQYSLMSTSIDKEQPLNSFKECKATHANIAVTRNIRFDTHIEQMNSLTYPTAYLHRDYPVDVLSVINNESSYLTNEELIKLIIATPMTLKRPQKTAKSGTSMLLSFLSLPGVLSANKTLAEQKRAIAADRKAGLDVTKSYIAAKELRSIYLKRMSKTLSCGLNFKYHDICDLKAKGIQDNL